MECQYFELPNKQTICCKIYNQKSEDKESIVLIHGNFSQLWWWDQTIEGLMDTSKKIIAVDLRGFGRSSYLNKCHGFGDWAKDVVQLLKLLKVNKAVLVGWSFGGAVCQKIAELAPDLVSKLILTCSVSHEGLSMPDAQGKLCKTSDQLLKLPKIAGAMAILNSKNKQAMRNVFDLVLFPKMTHTSEERKAFLADAPFRQRCYQQLLVALANTDIDINRIKSPTLLIHGSADVVLPVQSIMGTASKLGKLDLWQGHGHMIPIEDPKRFTEAIKKFINS